MKHPEELSICPRRLRETAHIYAAVMALERVDGP